MLTADEYLTWEEHHQERHELVGGRAYLMSGGTERHDLMTGHLFVLLSSGATSGGCRTFMANRKLKAGGNFYYPDVLVACGRAADVQYEADASVIVEVLSPSTRAQDRREKIIAYGTLRSLTHYVIVEPDIRRIEVARWDAERELNWTTLGPGCLLETPYGTWGVDGIYDAVDGLATT